MSTVLPVIYLCCLEAIAMYCRFPNCAAQAKGAGQATLFSGRCAKRGTARGGSGTGSTGRGECTAGFQTAQRKPRGQYDSVQRQVCAFSGRCAKRGTARARGGAGSAGRGGCTAGFQTAQRKPRGQGRATAFSGRCPKRALQLQLQGVVVELVVQVGENLLQVLYCTAQAKGGRAGDIIQCALSK